MPAQLAPDLEKGIELSRQAAGGHVPVLRRARTSPAQEVADGGHEKGLRRTFSPLPMQRKASNTRVLWKKARTEWKKARTEQERNAAHTKAHFIQ